jgi:hypothetical protein
MRNFKLGRFHGKIKPEDKGSEAQIQRKAFLSQMIEIVRGRKDEDKVKVRLFGYEVPLEPDKNRGKCVDLMGYDKELNLYLIELKNKDSRETITDVIGQLNGYVGIVEKIKGYIAEELEAELLLPIKFKDIKIMLLAPREFYKNKGLTDAGIDFGSFRDKDINERKSNEVIRVHLVKK